MDLYQFMLAYQDVFNPRYFLLLSAILIVFYDWKNSYQSIKHLFGRFTVISTSYLVGIRTMDILLQHVAGSNPDFPQYLEDFSAIAGMVLGLALCIALWKVLGYGREVMCGAIGLIAVSIPYSVISYFWNISGHVTFTVAPVAYLVALDKRLIPLYTIPAVMVLNRPIVGAHNIAQSVAGFILGTLLMIAGIWCYRCGKCTTR
ncbi:MAG: hypothetical protein DRO98_08085 [Archaeoglobales archaeon]|nr:MAG: hypothetical protein DRO98_08085 [Archaeoglobales archaeon]